MPTRQGALRSAPVNHGYLPVAYLVCHRRSSPDMPSARTSKLAMRVRLPSSALRVPCWSVAISVFEWGLLNGASRLCGAGSWKWRSGRPTFSRALIQTDLWKFERRSGPPFGPPNTNPRSPGSANRSRSDPGRFAPPRVCGALPGLSAIPVRAGPGAGSIAGRREVPGQWQTTGAEPLT
jgi:hypothetical protein